MYVIINTQRRQIMEKLSTIKELECIQKRFNLNNPVCLDDAHPVNGGHHHYAIIRADNGGDLMEIKFQNGPRNVAGSTHGVLDVDLLEIVRHRLQSFQGGPFATRENAIALTHIEEALLWLNKRVEDRAAKNTLGTDKV